MRRRLAGYLGEMAHLFGIRPWELDELTEHEADAFRRAIDERRAEGK